MAPATPTATPHVVQRVRALPRVVPALRGSSTGAPRRAELPAFALI